MKNWYCIIQGRDGDADYDHWVQIIKCKIEAPDKASARKIVESELNRTLPMRLLKKNIKPDSLLLSLYEISPGHFTESFFVERKCEYCGASYTLIDKFNMFGRFGNYDFCSSTCHLERDQSLQKASSNWGYADPVIYKITQISSGKCYIGKTIRSFTLRWWEHIKSVDECKFHKELATSSITDWVFQVIEVLSKGSSESFILEREKFYIDKFDSLENGFNAIGGTKNDNESVEDLINTNFGKAAAFKAEYEADL